MDRRGAVPDRVLGAAGVAMILLAAYLLLFGGPGDESAVDAADAPALELLGPPDGASVPLPVELRIGVERPLSAQPGGWGVDSFHVHAAIDGQEVMPGPTDVRRASPVEYVWTLPALPSGPHSVRLFWSDASHLPVIGTETPARSFTVR